MIPQRRRRRLRGDLCQRTDGRGAIGRQAGVVNAGPESRRPLQVFERADDELGLALAGPAHFLLDPLAQLAGGVRSRLVG